MTKKTTSSPKPQSTTRRSIAGSQESKRNNRHAPVGFFPQDDGYCVIELLFDAEQKPVNYRFLEVNQKFKQKTGLKNPVGKTVLELVPDIEKRWFEAYGEVALTGKPAHFEDSSEVMGRWFHVYASRFGGSESRKVALLFTDISEHTAAQRALRESEQHLRATFNQVAVGIAHMSLDGKWTRVNQKFCDIVGYSSKEILSQRFQDITHPDDFAASVRAANDIRDGQAASRSLEKRYIRKDGRVVWVSVTIAPSLGRTGRIKHFITVIEDITSRKQDAESLGYRSALLEAQNEATPEGILIVDAKGKILSYNRRFVRLWGIPKELLKAKDDNAALAFAMTKLHHPKKFLTRFNYLYKHPKEVSHEELILKDGRIFERYGAPVRKSGDELYGWAWFFQDITVRKQAETALRKSEERFRHLADSMPQMVWTADPDGRLDYYNRQWYEFTGFHKGETSQSWRLILHPDDADICLEAWQESVQTGQPYQMEYRFKDRHKPGTYRWFLGKALPVRDQSGQIVKWFGTCTDIDDIRRMLDRKHELEEMAADLREQHEQLLALSDAKDEFITLASHQLRTPATGVKQFVGMLLEGYEGKLTKGQRGMLEIAYESNERQLKIIDDLLKVAHVDAGRVRLSKSPCDFGKLLTDVIREQQSAFQKRHQKVVVHKPARVVKAEADPRMIRMVLENLIDNASKYSPEGKTITVDLSRKAGHAIIAISDQGVGIYKKDRDKLFQKFSRIDNPLSTTVSGTGLGLYWGKKIIDLHGGTISVTSKIRQGTTFTISL